MSYLLELFPSFVVQESADSTLDPGLKSSFDEPNIRQSLYASNLHVFSHIRLSLLHGVGMELWIYVVPVLRAELEWLW